jgi:T5SS/PEP-CTERM-associated repeat protein
MPRIHHSRFEGSRNRPAFLRWTALGALFATFATANAGTIRDDVPDSSYTSLAAQPEFSAAGELNTPFGFGAGTLVSSRWVLTAAHALNLGGSPGDFSFAAGAETRAGLQISFAPGWTGNPTTGNDLGLLKLSAPIGTVAPAQLYAGSAELNSTLTIVGYGMTGTGLTGGISPAGTRRAGENAIDRFAVFSPGGGFTTETTNGADRTGLVWDFDDPHGTVPNYFPATSALPLEYMPAENDSGAPMFLSAGGQTLLAGVVSYGINHAAPDDPSTYGDIAIATRVSQFTNWIEDTIANRWTNTGGGTFADGANWADGTPWTSDIASFDAPGARTVALTATASTSKLLVRAGTVTLDLGGSVWTQTSASGNGSVTVARSNGDSATLRITNGKLAAVDGFVAAQAGSTGLVTLTGAGTEWTLSESLFIGGSRDGAGGNGSVTVGSGAKLSVGQTLKIFAGAQLDIAGSMAATAIDISGGTLLLSGASSVRDRVNDDAAVFLNGNAVNQNGVVSILTRGLSEVTGLIVDAQHPNGINSGTHGLGALTLSSNSVLDFGADNTTLGVLQFASLTGDPITNAGRTLDIVNWNGNAAGGGLDQLRFDTSIAGAIDLSQIRFFDGFGQGLGSGMQIAFNGYFEIVPVPEPATVFGAVFLLGLAGWHERRRPAPEQPTQEGSD